MRSPIRKRAQRACATICAALAVPILVAGTLFACSSAPKLQGAGSPCLVVADCQLGLVCVAQRDATRKCSSDLSTIVDTQDGAVVGAPPPRMAGDGDSGSSGDLSPAAVDDASFGSTTDAQDAPAPD